VPTNIIQQVSNTAKNKSLPSHLNNDRILLSQPGQVSRDPMDEVVAKRLQIAPPEYLIFKKITGTGPEFGSMFRHFLDPDLDS
jgi:hypothetical protein